MPRRKHNSPAAIATTSASELRMRGLLATIFPDERARFNHRPRWLRGCELDVFYPGIEMAFEFNGQQHNKFCPKFHRNVADFDAQVERDFFKASECARRNIRLVIVEYKHIKSETHLRERIAEGMAALGGGQAPGDPLSEPTCYGDRRRAAAHWSQAAKEMLKAVGVAQPKSSGACPLPVAPGSLDAFCREYRKKWGSRPSGLAIDREFPGWRAERTKTPGTRTTSRGRGPSPR